jgi:REP element-mobilizing transposase RayT
MGSCLLKDTQSAGFVAEGMRHFDGDRYELGAYVVMPNHVHAVVRPTHTETHSLESILGSWKQFASGKVNARAGTNGSLWQEEGFDRIIRDGEHLYRVLQYIGRNPKKAGLDPESRPLWIRPEWEQLGWRFEPA